MDHSLSLPPKITKRLGPRVSGEIEAAIRDFLDSEKEEFYEYLDAYRVLLGGEIVDGSLTVDHVDLEGTEGTASMSFQESSNRGCDKLDQDHFHSQGIRFRISDGELILNFFAPADSDEPEL